MSRKTILCIIYIAGLMLCCAGCGRKRDDTDVSAQDMSTEQVPVTTEEPKPVTDEDGFYAADDYVKVTDELADVRVKAEDSAAIYILAHEGTFLKRTGYNDVWTRVELENTSFYVLSSSVVEEEPPKQEEEGETATDGDAEDGEQLVKKVVIDPANQASANVGTEEVGPRSGDTKQCATSGTIGTTFGTRESELNLEYAKLLKSELENRGYEVVLTREENDVNLSNKERAEIANSSGASAFIRIQMNESSNAELNGVMSVCMTAGSPYNSDLYEDSKALASRLLQGVTAATGATNRGVVETDQMTAINWSTIPVAVINLGFLTNPTDEGNLISESYRNSMVQGLADGIDYFFQ